MMRKHVILLLIAIAGAFTAAAQTLQPVTWSVTTESTSRTEATVVLHAKVEKGWHLYGLTLPDDGPNATQITFQLPEGIKTDGPLTPSVQPVEKFDPIFSLNLSWWDTDVNFTQKLILTDSRSHKGSVKIMFQGCNDQTCISPQRLTLDFQVGSGPAAADEAADSTAEPEETAVPSIADKAVENSTADWWEPVDITADMAGAQDIAPSSWWKIFLWGFGGGLLALLTPCVWPMIPMTVSFFLKKSKSRSRAITDAVTYGLSIIVIYLTLGLAITGICGASTLNELATNAWFNMAFFLLLVIFGISFLGGFDIKLPSRWSNTVDSKAESTSGLVSIFFMAFTLALVSFSCTGPILSLIHI